MHITEGWFSRIGDVPGAPRLFYFPYAGGNPAAVLPWQDELGDSVELQVAALPGRGVRLFETPLYDLAELVDRLTDGIAGRTDRPFAFFGHSLGALVAFEVARELRRRGLPGPMCLWAVGCEGPQTRSVKERLHDLPQPELVAALRDYSGTPSEVLDDAELTELLLPGIRADFALSEQYRYQPEPPLELPIIVLRGSDDPYVQADLATGWSRESARPLQEHCFVGDHFFVEPHRDEIIDLVVGTLTDLAANPYRALPARSFWRSAVAEPAPAEITELWQPGFTLGPDDPIITAGSCFARELGRALLAAGLNFYDAELPPPGLSRAEQQDRHYGQFSFRTGNIYTATMLRQWLSWAVGESVPPVGAWAEGDRFVDGYRPSVQPTGHRSESELLADRDRTLAAIRAAVGQARCLIFTLGLTEAWRDAVDGTEYPVCPGTIRGRFDPQRHVFHNAAFAEVYRDLTAALELARSINPELRVVLTVSPVPLTATATGGHALVASSYSKSVLRAVAGQLATESDQVDYFPSYELITGAPFRAGFFEANLRTVSAEGVAFVLRHFLGAVCPGLVTTPMLSATGGDPACDDAVLDYYRTG
ncbi:MAG TPA: GSCFA domain-containing protein [Jatrophihabitans sp.]|nr:GSCFA domain-containing protein [Jatrophihabitans sp.]